ncbi:MAG TPA: TetR/AcrR family transcriptional regulator, partial [Microthrixaceae bacterium]|nr:TetR/AcrR family transcriptional regulator [Microthrixaceae bacterium]
MTDVTARIRNPRGQGDRLRDDLIEAALVLMSEHGDPEAVSIRAVAKAAGVTPTAAYRHFEDRDALVVAACEANFEQFAAFLLPYYAELDDPFERLLGAGRGYLDFAEGDPGRYRVLFSNPITQSVKADAWPDMLSGDTAFAQLISLVQGCITAGAKPQTDDAVYLSFQLWTWIHGIVDLRITHPGMDWPDAWRMFVDVT